MGHTDDVSLADAAFIEHFRNDRTVLRELCEELKLMKMERIQLECRMGKYQHELYTEYDWKCIDLKKKRRYRFVKRIPRAV